MKKLTYLLIIVITIITLNGTLFAQKDNPAIIKNVSEEFAWDAVYQSFKEHKKRLYNYNKNTQIAKSGFIKYKSLLIDNRAKYQVSYKNNTIEIKFINRQYMSKKGWTDNLLPLSRKTKKKLIYPIAERIKEIVRQKAEEEKSIGSKENPPGIYEDAFFVRTEDSIIHILGAYKDGSTIGIQLNEDKTKTKSIVYKQNENAPAFTMIMDENNIPKAATFENQIFRFVNYTGTTFDIIVQDENGEITKHDSIEFILPADITSDMIIDFDKGNGPMPPFVFPGNDDDISFWLGVTGNVIGITACAITVFSAGTSSALTVLPCLTTLISVMQATLPEDHFIQSKNLTSVNDLASLLSGGEGAWKLFKNPEVFKKLSKIKKIEFVLDKAGTIIDGMKRQLNGANRLIERFLPLDVKLQIAGAESIERGEKVNFLVNSNYQKINTYEWECIGNSIEKVPWHGQKDRTIVKAFEDATTNNTAKIKVTQTIKGRKYYIIKRVNIVGGNSAPIAKFNIDPGMGDVSTNFNFDASASSDLQDKKSDLKIRWDWTNDGKWDTPLSTKKTQQHKYPKQGNYIARMEVTDSNDESSQITHEVEVIDNENNPASNPSATSCPKKMYKAVLSEIKDMEQFHSQVEEMISKGWKVSIDNLFFIIYEKENSSNTIHKTKILTPKDNSDISTLNQLGYNSWEIITGFLNIFLEKNENQQKFEYKFCKDAPKLSKYNNYLPNGGIISKFNSYGKNGWELVSIADDPVFKKTQNDNSIFEYKSFIIQNYTSYNKLKNLGIQGWKYCTMPVVLTNVFDKSWPIILKRRKNKNDSFEFRFVPIYFEKLSLFNTKNFDEKFKNNINRLESKINEFGAKGWKFETIIFGNKEFFGENKVLLLFQVPASCL